MGPACLANANCANCHMSEIDPQAFVDFTMSSDKVAAQRWAALRGIILLLLKSCMNDNMCDMQSSNKMLINSCSFGSLLHHTAFVYVRVSS